MNNKSYGILLIVLRLNFGRTFAQGFFENEQEILEEREGKFLGQIHTLKNNGQSKAVSSSDYEEMEIFCHPGKNTLTKICNSISNV